MSELPPFTPSELMAIRVAGWVCLYENVQFSVSEIARKFGVRPTRVAYHLAKAGVKMRPRRRAARPPIIWNGRRYCYTTGKRCYVSYSQPRTYLARDVWEYHYGPIPEGMQIWHLDGDPSNNAIENLACLSPSDGQRMHVKRKEDPCVRGCLYCGKVLERKTSPAYRCNGGLEPFRAFVRRRFCGPECVGLAQKGKPRTWSPDNPVERTYPIKHCAYCGEQLVPHVQRGGKWDGLVEPLSVFMKRKCCNKQCGAQYRRRAR